MQEFFSSVEVGGEFRAIRVFSGFARVIKDVKLGDIGVNHRGNNSVNF